MSDRFEPFPCGDCGGTVRMLSAKGEVREFRRGVRVHVPESVLVPRCERCGETYLGERDSARVDAAVREVFLGEQKRVYAACVAALQREHGATLREIERVCGVTPTYFSHVMKGRRVASLTLTRLLEAFVACPAEFARHAHGEVGDRPASPSERRGFHGTASGSEARAPRPVAGVFSKGRRWPPVPAHLQGAA